MSAALLPRAVDEVDLEWPGTLTIATAEGRQVQLSSGDSYTNDRSGKFHNFHQKQHSISNLQLHKGGVIGIKIGWMCDLDKSDDQCNPSYSFTRLDAMSQKNTVSPGYNFRFAKYYKMENGNDYRTLVKAYAIRFDVLVNGNAGKFDMIPTLINMVAAFTSIGVGTVLCDIILLNFLKGAELYKTKKFEESTTERFWTSTRAVQKRAQQTAMRGAFTESDGGREDRVKSDSLGAVLEKVHNPGAELCVKTKVFQH
ncbi:P2X purinoceptor 3-like isoform X2 [Syngnathoides biaculeatus]|uniref:P2X purinoceptor 3-like isoform X2 n=1 Tax=Syngnathoides biaculeatus TaxID=300417 RepID=UPI002ADE03F8|nr:P2X purinoceptor 3-like isoform X2 [Syngnathoides biaculeatus]